MPKLLATILPVLVLLGLADPAGAGDDRPARACPGITTSQFEQRFPHEVERYAFGHSLVQPFIELWHLRSRPDLPVPPERVTVYALPDHPLLVGYQSGDCVIAFLAVERDQLLHLLRPRLGWPI